MAAPIDLRNDFDSVSLRRLAKRTRDATQSRRLLALAEVYDGGSRTDASRIGGVGLQIIRDWVLRFNARGPDGLVDGKSPGAPSKLNAITAAHWRRLLRPARSRRSTGRALAAQGPGAVALGDVRHLARRDHGRARVEGARLRQDLGAAAPLRAKRAGRRGFKKNFPAELAKIRARLPKGVEIELWWQDEARIGQKNKLTRRWARRGTRPRAPRDQRTECIVALDLRGSPSGDSVSLRRLKLYLDVATPDATAEPSKHAGATIRAAAFSDHSRHRTPAKTVGLRQFEAIMSAAHWAGLLRPGIIPELRRLAEGRVR